MLSTRFVSLARMGHYIPHIVIPVWLSDALTISLFASSLFFALSYWKKAPWWGSAMGRNIFIFDACIAAITFVGVLAILFRTIQYDAFTQWLDVSIYVMIIGLVNHRTAMLFRENTRDPGMPVDPGPVSQEVRAESEQECGSESR